MADAVKLRTSHELEPLRTQDDLIHRTPVEHTDAESDSGDETNSSDEFDWDAEDTPKSIDGPGTSARRGRALWRLFIKLSRPIRTLLVGIIGAGILVTPLLVVRFQFNDSPARPHAYAWSLWLAITWAAGTVTYLVVDLIPRLCLSLVWAFRGQTENLKTQIELFMAISGWIKLALDISWMWIALSVIRRILHPPGSYWVIVNRVMQALFSASLLMLVEKAVLQFIAIRFHAKALADRLAENKVGLKALERLSTFQPNFSTPKKGRKKKSPFSSRSASMDAIAALASRPGTPVEKQDRAREKAKEKLGVENGTTQLAKKSPRQRKKKAVAAVIVDQLGDVISQVALKNSSFNQDLGSLQSARKLAKKLFAQLSDDYPARQHLVVEDFYPYFPSTAEATAAFHIFDKDNNGDISKSEMREAVQRIYKERKALTASLKDVGSAVAKLDAVLVAVALMFILFVCLLIFNRSNTIASLVPLATIILGFSFIFGHSAQLLFESLIFIFSTHIFDTGDLVLIDDQVLFVKEFGLYSTTFTRVDGHEIVAPNTLIANTKLVHNLRRSNSMWETTNITVAYDTPLQVIDQLRVRLQQFVAENSRDWLNTNLNIDKMEFQNAITLVIGMEHRSNWQNWGARWDRRTLFMTNLKSVLEELEITYTMPTVPVTFQGSFPGMTVASPRYEAGTELGNAGAFAAGGLGRAPTRSMKSGTGNFNLS